VIDLDVRPAHEISRLTTVDLDSWLAAQALLDEAQHPIWDPSSGAGRRTNIRGVEHLAVFMAGLGRTAEGFAVIEWPRPFPHPWAQTRSGGGGLLVELNDGVVTEGRDSPCTRRAFHGNPGDHPFPNELDPRYKTPQYLVPRVAVFAPLQGAELIWTWIHTRVLPPGISVTMQHFGANERRSFDCGDL
jgi:hypothetical protein